MNNLSKDEINDKLIKYLSKKGINITLDYNNMVWNYEPHYSKFKITIYPERSDDDKLIIRYYTNHYNLDGLKRRRTSITNSFCNSVYKNLIWIKEKLDVIANDVKYKTDTKNKYCSELEEHYKTIHKNVTVSINENTDSKNIVISGQDTFEKYSNYYITYKDNRYYMNNKVSYLNEVLDMGN